MNTFPLRTRKMAFIVSFVLVLCWSRYGNLKHLIREYGVITLHIALILAGLGLVFWSFKKNRIRATMILLVCGVSSLYLIGVMPFSKEIAVAYPVFAGLVVYYLAPPIRNATTHDGRP
jgi:predicted membrane channel-forming protein YqfA (hemolysin III family)